MKTNLVISPSDNFIKKNKEFNNLFVDRYTYDQCKTKKSTDQFFSSKLDLDYTQYIKLDKKFYRAEELKFLKGDCSKAKKILGWNHEYTFETMLDEMIQYWENLPVKNIF